MLRAATIALRLALCAVIFDAPRLGVAIIVTMPNRHSESKRLCRAVRALERHFIQKLPLDLRHVEVPAFLRERVKPVVKSMQIHHQHVTTYKEPFHAPKVASWAARNDQGAQTYNKEMKVHTRRDKALHDWEKVAANSQDAREGVVPLVNDADAWSSPGDPPDPSPPTVSRCRS